MSPHQIFKFEPSQITFLQVDFISENCNNNSTRIRIPTCKHSTTTCCYISSAGFQKFVMSLANHQQTNNILTDIYDGQVWKNFKKTNEEDSSKFFRNDV